MADDLLKRVLAAREALERDRRELDHAQGVLDQVLAQLKDEFGVGSLKAARQLLKRLRAEEAEFERLLYEGLKEYEKRCGRRTNDVAKDR